MKKTKKLIKRLIISCAVLISLPLIWWFNTCTLRTTELTIRDERIKNEITIVHITDLHGSSFGKDNTRLLSRIEKAEPDFVVVTGDMWTRFTGSEGMETAVRFMTVLGERYKVFFVDGGHDGSLGRLIKDGEINAVFLEFQSTEIITGETRLGIHGVPDRYFASSNTTVLEEVFELDNAIYNIMLAHEARFQTYTDLGVDLSLCGHTHGGIIRLPLIGTPYSRSNTGRYIWFPEFKGIAHLYGLIENENSKLFISSGLGAHPAPVRLFNRPEVVVIRLLPQA